MGRGTAREARGGGAATASSMAPPSALRAATSPSLRDREDQQLHFGFATRFGAVVANSARVRSPDLSPSAPANRLARRRGPFLEGQQIIAILVELAKRRGPRGHQLDAADPVVAVAVEAVEAPLLALTPLSRRARRAAPVRASARIVSPPESRPSAGGVSSGQHLLLGNLACSPPTETGRRSAAAQLATPPIRKRGNRHPSLRLARSDRPSQRRGNRATIAADYRRRDTYRQNHRERPAFSGYIRVNVRLPPDR